MLAIERSNQFKKDVKLMLKRGKSISKLKHIMIKLVRGESLPIKNKDHQLLGNFKNARECHIEGDWLLIYVVSSKIIRFERTGTHSDLFR